jgi:recombination protein RecA
LVFLGEEKVGQGRDSAREYMEQNSSLAAELEGKLRKIIFPGRLAPESKAISPPASASTEAAAKPKKAAPEELGL